MLPTIRWKELHHVGHTIPDERLEQPWATRQPTQDDHTVSPSVDTVGGNSKYSLKMMKISEEVSSPQLEARNCKTLYGSNSGLGHDERDVNGVLSVNHSKVGDTGVGLL